MGKAIVIGIVIIVLALILAGIAVWTMNHTTKRELGLSPRQLRRQQSLNVLAAEIFRNAGAASTIEDSDILSDRTMKARDQWLQNYNNLNREINA